jgi:hypothetical protein
MYMGMKIFTLKGCFIELQLFDYFCGIKNTIEIGCIAFKLIYFILFTKKNLEENVH